jgi:hypothetical protein
VQVLQRDFAWLDEQFIGRGQGMLHLLGQLLELLRALLVHLQILGTLHLLLYEVPSLKVQHSWHMSKVSNQIWVADSHDYVPQFLCFRLLCELLNVLVIDGDVGSVVSLGLERADEGQQDEHSVGAFGGVVSHD